MRVSNVQQGTAVIRLRPSELHLETLTTVAPATDHHFVATVLNLRSHFVMFRLLQIDRERWKKLKVQQHVVLTRVVYMLQMTIALSERVAEA